MTEMNLRVWRNIAKQNNLNVVNSLRRKADLKTLRLQGNLIRL